MKIRIIFLFLITLGVAFESTRADSDKMQPKRHFKVLRPLDLSSAEALIIYDNIAERLGRGYIASGDPTAKNYRKWRRYNTTPYRSAAHGNRYLNHYGNAKSAGYPNTQKGAKLPAGAIIAKDSFAVSTDMTVFAGPLYIMEKLPAGHSPKTGDWRYVMIMPDGSYFGDSMGENARNVAFCHGCHSAVSRHDNLYFVPKKYRRYSLTD